MNPHASRRIALLWLGLIACSERGRPPFAYQSALTLGVEGDALTVDVAQSFSGDGEVLLDSVTATISERGVQTFYDDPDVSENAALDISDRSDGTYRFRLAIDHPITDWDRLEGSCALAGRTITVDATYYSDRNDQSQADDPPLFAVSTTAPLVAPSLPSGSGTFSLSRWWQVDLTLEGAVGDVFQVTPGETDSVLISAFTNRTWALYRAPVGSSGEQLDSGEFEERPVGAAPFVGPLVWGGRIDGGDIPRIGIRSQGNGLDLELSRTTDPEYPAAHLASLSPSENGVYAVLQTSFAVPDTEGGLLTPPPDKYYGAFLVEIGPDLTVTAVEASDRDILYVGADQDGSVLRVTGDLPPRTDPTGIHVERRDANGQLIWTYDDPTVALHASVRSQPGGGAIVAFESSLPSETVVVVSLDGTGTPIYRYTAFGRSPTIATGSEGATLLAFSGVEPSLPALPTRQVPLLVELSPEGVPVRGQQLGCGGTAVVANTGGGAPVLAGALDELADLGDSLEAADPTRLSVVEID